MLTPEQLSLIQAVREMFPEIPVEVVRDHVVSDDMD